MLSLQFKTAQQKGVFSAPSRWSSALSMRRSNETLWPTITAPSTNFTNAGITCRIAMTTQSIAFSQPDSLRDCVRAVTYEGGWRFGRQEGGIEAVALERERKGLLAVHDV